MDFYAYFRLRELFAKKKKKKIENNRPTQILTCFQTCR